MTFTIPPDMKARILARLEAGNSARDLALEILERTPLKMVSLSIAGNVKPDFQKEIDEGKTVGEVFGKFTIKNLLDKSLEKIRVGHYFLSPALAQELKQSRSGTYSRGEWAGLLFVREHSESTDEENRVWASGVLEEIRTRFGLTELDMSVITTEQIKHMMLLPVPKPIPTGPTHSRAQGQTPKPGGHRESHHN